MSTSSISSPDKVINCLLIQPSFDESNFWNYRRSCQLIGANTPAPPLGLLTVAAILPQHWNFRLHDLNVIGLEEVDWTWADIICVGGMLPQQSGIIQVIEECRRRDIFVVVGGPDPSSQPEIYSQANALILGEGENTIPKWLDSWRQGSSEGTFSCDEKPDVTLSPPPRYDLIDFNHYVHVGIQISRGCPFNCEFCDIIELYGRKPRVKTTEQILAELQTIYQLGYRGWIDIVDDNFIGNKKLIKKFLPHLEGWSEKRKFPFFFSTEASMNLADDRKLMEQMARCDFRYVFMGIETPDKNLLLQAQKSQNTVHPIAKRIQTVYEYGMAVSAGYIMGFDGEKKGMDESMIECIRETGTIMAMVGLLVALPNTQLTRRLQREKRLLSPSFELIEDDSPYRVSLKGSIADGVDQTVGGLNFVTDRDRIDILDEYSRVIRTSYSPEEFMNRVLSTTKSLKMNRRHWPMGWELKRSLWGMLRLMLWMTKNPRTRKLFWRNAISSLMQGIQKFDFAMNMMGMFVHFEGQTVHLLSAIEKRKEIIDNQANYPRFHLGQHSCESVELESITATNL